MFRKPCTSKSMGIEIELFYDRQDNPNWDGDEPYIGFWRQTTDGSIVADRWSLYTREMVSQPLPKEWLKKEIDRLSKKLVWQSNDTCGIHVHVSRKWLHEDRARLIWNFLQTLTHDDSRYLFGRIENSYCRVTASPGFGKTRYNAVNVENDHTIEFRMFRSGSAQWAKYCVDMVDYLITNAKHLNIDAAHAFRDMYPSNI